MYILTALKEGCPVLPDHRSQVVLLAVLAVLVGMALGCANLSHGSTQSIRVESDPSGAQVTVDTDPVAYIAPATIVLKRGQDHVLVFRKEGFENYSAELTRSQSAAVYGNLILGGLPGLMTDYGSGAAYELGNASLVNDTLTIKLVPKPSVAAAAPSTKPLPATPGQESATYRPANTATQPEVQEPQPEAGAAAATQPRLSPPMRPEDDYTRTK
jgi:PEGA domain